MAQSQPRAAIDIAYSADLIGLTSVRVYLSLMELCSHSTCYHIKPKNPSGKQKKLPLFLN